MNKKTLAIAAAALIATSGLAFARPAHTTVRAQQTETAPNVSSSLRNSYNSYAPAPSDSLAGEEFYGVNSYHHAGSNDWDAYQQDD